MTLSHQNNSINITGQDREIIFFPHGLIGFPNERYFQLIKPEYKNLNQFFLLKSMHDNNFAFLIINNNIVKFHKGSILKAAQKSIKFASNSVQTFMIATSKSSVDKEKLLLNVEAPIFIDLESNLGMQCILDDYENEIGIIYMEKRQLVGYTEKI